jgi:hypothetical protein
MAPSEDLEKDSWGWVQGGYVFGSSRSGFVNGHQQAQVTENEVQDSWVRHWAVHYGDRVTALEVLGSSDVLEDGREVPLVIEDDCH